MGWLSRFRRPAVKPDKPQVVPNLRLDQQFSRIGGGVTPAQLSTYLRSADSGNIKQLIDHANEARQKDCHLQAILATREAALSGLEFMCQAITPPGENKPPQDAIDIADFVQSALRRAEGRGGNSKSFADCVSHLSGASYFGFSVSETDYTVRDSKIVPAGFFLMSHRRFEFSQSDGVLQWYDESVMTEGVRLQEKYPDKFIQHQPRINGDVPAREGLMRVLLWSALFRNWDVADWLKLAELSWKPWRFGVYKSGASDKDIEDLIIALQYLTTAGVCMHSDRTDVHVEWPERGRGARPEHAVLAEFLGSEMSKAVLGQTLTTEQGERGARSLGEIHDRVRKDIREMDAIQMASTIRRDLIAPIVRLNFGLDAPVPEFWFVTEDTPDLGSFLRGIESATRAGLKIKQAWVRDKAGMDHPEAGDELLPGQQGNIPIYEGDEWPDFGDGEEDVDLSDLEDDEESEGDDEEDTGEDTDSE